VASTDDGTVFVATANGIDVYAGGNVGKRVADLPLKTNPNCIAVHGNTVAVGAEVSRKPHITIISFRLSPLYIDCLPPGSEALFVYLGRHITQRDGQV
jgi:hypothetical protein